MRIRFLKSGPPCSAARTRLPPLLGCRAPHAGDGSHVEGAPVPPAQRLSARQCACRHPARLASPKWKSTVRSAQAPASVLRACVQIAPDRPNVSFGGQRTLVARCDDFRLFGVLLSPCRPRQCNPVENLADKKMSLNGGKVFSNDLVVEPQTKQASRVAWNFKLNDNPLDRDPAVNAHAFCPARHPRSGAASTARGAAEPFPRTGSNSTCSQKESKPRSSAGSLRALVGSALAWSEKMLSKMCCLSMTTKGFVTLPWSASRRFGASRNSQTAATAVRHVSIAAARST
jgi:hypothetical protein